MAGIHRRLPGHIFSLLDSMDMDANSSSQHVKFSSYELLAKRCFELLPSAHVAAASEGAVDAKAEIFLRVDGDGVTNVCGVAEHTATDEQSLIALLGAAAARRETSATGANATSSRSHAVYVVELPSDGRINLIDLAGNESSQETLFHTKSHIAECKEISNSLATLRACLRTRGAAEVGAHVPFRESVLTRVLKDALTDRDAATALLACVSPCCTHVEHSLRTLRTAVYLVSTVDDESSASATIEEEELHAAAVVKKGPATWDNNELCAWVKEQSFAAQVRTAHRPALSVVPFLHAQSSAITRNSALLVIYAF